MRVKTLAVLMILVAPVAFVSAEEHWKSTRIESDGQHRRAGSDSYPFRAWSDYILKELDLREGDVVADIGAGDGWWTALFADRVGASGRVIAGEVEQEKVDQLAEKFKDNPSVKPMLFETDSTGLGENSIDLAFFAQVYHHLDEDVRVEYLNHLRGVAKPSARLCVIEKYTDIATVRADHGTNLGDLVKTAEDAGWIAVRYELITGTNHYLAIFAQKDLFCRAVGAIDASPRVPAEELTHTEESIEDMKKRVAAGEAVMVDVREPREWAGGYIDGAVLLSMSEVNQSREKDAFEKLVENKLPKNKILYVHCAKGGRALGAARWFHELGYDARPVKPGFEQLADGGVGKAAKYELAKSE